MIAKIAKNAEIEKAKAKARISRELTRKKGESRRRRRGHLHPIARKIGASLGTPACAPHSFFR